MNFKELYRSDLNRYGDNIELWNKQFHYYFRKVQVSSSRIMRLFYRFRLKQLKSKRGIEIPSSVKVGKGLYLGHAYNITINEAAVIGDNCNIHKGVVIGKENRGSREGSPSIGNMVWIGINAAVVGCVTIGDDVLIAPNSYVNCDVASHSIVYGNPCIVKQKNNATQSYVNRLS